MPSVPEMGDRVAGAQLDCQFVFLFGSLPIPAIKVQSECERSMGLPETIVQCQGLGRGRLRFAKSILARKHAIFPIARQGVRVSQTGICFGMGRIGFDRALEILDRRPQTISGSLVPKIPSFKIGLISLRVYGLRLL